MKITLRNGVEIPVNGCGVTGKELHIDIPSDYGFVETVTMLDNPEATSEIVYTSSAETVTYSGYTHIYRVGYSPWMENTLSVTLEKGE